MTPPMLPLPQLNHPGTMGAFLRFCDSQVGYREGSNNDTIFGLDYGLNHQSWCAMFISVMAKLTGNSTAIPKYAYTPSGAEWFKSRNQWGTHPRQGAIGFVYYRSEGRIGHTFVVLRLNSDGSFTTVEGNSNNSGAAQGDGVYRLKRRELPSGSGFGYPKYPNGIGHLPT
jgi:CHAP domain